jgi:hypothetical protein
LTPVAATPSGRFSATDAANEVSATICFGALIRELEDVSPVKWTRSASTSIPLGVSALVAVSAPLRCGLDEDPADFPDSGCTMLSGLGTLASAAGTTATAATELAGAACILVCGPTHAFAAGCLSGTCGLVVVVAPPAESRTKTDNTLPKARTRALLLVGSLGVGVEFSTAELVFVADKWGGEGQAQASVKIEASDAMSGSVA